MTLTKHSSVIALAVMSALTLTVSAVAARGTREVPAASQASERSIQGVWRTVVTPRNCQTGVAGPLFIQGSFTFAEGGTMSEYGIGPGASPALRSPGHGVWQREHGWNAYSFAFMFYRYDASGILLGSQKVTGTLELGPSGDEFTTASIVDVLDLNGTRIGGGCATAAGTRFAWNPPSGE